MERKHAVALNSLVGHMLVDVRKLIAYRNGCNEIELINIYEELIKTGQILTPRVNLIDLQTLHKLEQTRQQIADYLLAIIED